MYDILKLLGTAFVLCMIFLLFFQKKKKRRRVNMIVDFNHNYLNIKNKNPMELKINVGEFSVGTLGLVDHDTQLPVQATFSNPDNSSDDETVVTVDSNNKVVGVGEGFAIVTIKSDVEYTDANTGQPVKTTKSVEVGVTVSTPPPPQEVDLVVTFSPAQPV